jgi:hypothetical protein
VNIASLIDRLIDAGFQRPRIEIEATGQMTLDRKRVYGIVAYDAWGHPFLKELDMATEEQLEARATVLVDKLIRKLREAEASHAWAMGHQWRGPSKP